MVVVESVRCQCHKLITQTQLPLVNDQLNLVGD